MKINNSNLRQMAFILLLLFTISTAALSFYSPELYDHPLYVSLFFILAGLALVASIFSRGSILQRAIYLTLSLLLMFSALERKYNHVEYLSLTQKATSSILLENSTIRLLTFDFPNTKHNNFTSKIELVHNGVPDTIRLSVNHPKCIGDVSIFQYAYELEPELTSILFLRTNHFVDILLIISLVFSLLIIIYTVKSLL
jgi:hypothetical protein